MFEVRVTITDRNQKKYRVFDTQLNEFTKSTFHSRGEAQKFVDVKNNPKYHRAYLHADKLTSADYYTDNERVCAQ